MLWSEDGVPGGFWADAHFVGRLSRRLSATCLLAAILAGGCGGAPPAGTPVTASSPVRTVAEWEPAIGSVIAWPLIVPGDLVVELAKDDPLYIVVPDEISRYEAEDSFAEWGVNGDNVRFVVTALGLGWAWPRDWGPHAVVSDKGAFHWADPLFVGYPWMGRDCITIRPDRFPTDRFLWDDRATAALAESLGFETAPMKVAVTGGNFLVDGHGTAFATCLLEAENRMLGGTDAEYAGILEHTLGISRLVILPNYEDDGIQHIDCAIKPLDEETILVMRVPEDHAEHAVIEEMVRTLESLDSVYGRPYQIIRIDSGRYQDERVAAYTNSLILNRKVLVPLFGIPEDEGALATFREAMPGYEVLGFKNDIPVPVMGYAGWQGFDALHCRVRAIFDPEMLSMTHRRLDETMPPAETYPIEVTIRDHSRAGLISEELLLFVRTTTVQAWRSIPLEPDADPAVFSASIPGAAAGETIDYYLTAADSSGRSESLPRSAPAGYYSFSVSGGDS